MVMNIDSPWCFSSPPAAGQQCARTQYGKTFENIAAVKIPGHGITGTARIISTHARLVNPIQFPETAIVTPTPVDAVPTWTTTGTWPPG